MVRGSEMVGFGRNFWILEATDGWNRVDGEFTYHSRTE